VTPLWTGPGITSSAARTDPRRLLGIGAIEASDYLSLYGPGAMFEGQAIDTSAVLVKVTYYGDADFNGRVDFDDFSLIDRGFNIPGNTPYRQTWFHGDFDSNGVTNFDDYALIDRAFTLLGADDDDDAPRSRLRPRAERR
jgi:hypothetical protein